METEMNQYFGIYRGVVINNSDPMQLGRVLAQVPDVLGTVSTSWAMPCVPCGLLNKVGSALPQIGASVWIEFEQGNPDHPVWIGCFYTNAAETPPALRNSK
jgi:hypothetical protein